MSKSNNISKILFLVQLANRLTRLFWVTLMFRFCVQSNVILLDSGHDPLCEADDNPNNPGFNDWRPFCLSIDVHAHFPAVEFRVKRQNHQLNFPDNSSCANQNVPDRHSLIISLFNTLQ